ncbi:ubiquinone/menaquinone biosynthesis C-methylase UbiE [Curtobacterium sp. AG1037]|uniref:class I SAM-dependent methyltransferase n=1 Tax=Curtobacterium sp. AG1037 TaxID=2183990 RepID=UPI000E0B8FCB|nr:class I SAM-dependent methyltransferase [Curtobacterium sp. AG1037]RDI02186.1 ubiquinone/menaquinone biosynthesis C-methylase UbiE [Curtobacterium sp. AG1037]
MGERVDERADEPADERVQRAYAARADEYAAVLGSMDAVHVADRTHVEQWAAGCHGVVVDAGCGPGHWAAHLAGLGHRVVGLDAVPAFVAIARRTAPDVEVRRATLESTGLPAGSVGGVLSWYSLVHHEPDAVPVALAEFHRVLDAGGGLLVGAFAGAVLEPFDHAVTTAWRWPEERLVAAVEDAGFTVVDVREREDEGVRPHLAVSAVRAG